MTNFNWQVMENGRIAQAEKFDVLLEQSKEFQLLVKAQTLVLGSTIKTENLRRIFLSAEKEVTTPDNSQRTLENIGKNQFYASDKKSLTQYLCHVPNDTEKMMQEQEKEKGSISKEAYWSYLTAVNGGSLAIAIVMVECLIQVLQVANNYWMAWASPTRNTDPTIETSFLFSVYMLLSLGSSLCVLVQVMLTAISGHLTSQKLFRDMLQSIFHAPLSFMEKTPTVCIINRVSNPTISVKCIASLN